MESAGGHSQAASALVLASYPFTADPRHGLWVRSLEELGWTVESAELQVSGDPRIFSSARGSARTHVQDWSLPFSRVCRAALGDFSKGRDGLSQGRDRIIEWLLLEAARLRPSYSGYIAREALSAIFAVRHHAASCEPQIVVANDFPAAIAATLRWSESDTAVIYDCQEIFPELYFLPSPPMSLERMAPWRDLDSAVMRASDLVVSVSPGHSRLLLEERGIQSIPVPNFQGLIDAVPNRAPTSGPIKCVFMGHAQPQRGLDWLAESWNLDRSIATLDFYLPSNGYSTAVRKQVADASAARPHVQMIVRDPVPPREMIPTLAGYDLGVMPYQYGYPYCLASPNKFGEYLAAGLAVVTTRNMEFVADCVTHFGLGAVVDPVHPDALREAVVSFSSGESLRRVKNASAQSFFSTLNWDDAVRPTMSILQRSPGKTRSVVSRVAVPKSGSLKLSRRLLTIRTLSSLALMARLQQSSHAMRRSRLGLIVSDRLRRQFLD